MARILSLTGLSGAGKTTLAGRLIELHRHVGLVESITTRAKRDTDLPGEYRYVSGDEFLHLERTGSFAWTARHGDTLYGTARRTLERALNQEERVGIMILVPSVLPKLKTFVDAHVKNRDPNDSWIACYVISPSPEITLSRLRGRGDSEELIRERMQAEAYWEREIRDFSDHKRIRLIRNSGRVEEALDHLGLFLYPNRIA